MCRKSRQKQVSKWKKLERGIVLHKWGRKSWKIGCHNIKQKVMNMGRIYEEMWKSDRCGKADRREGLGED